MTSIAHYPNLRNRVRRFTVLTLTCLLTLASSAAIAGVDPEVQKHFDAGNSKYQDGLYADALVEYDAAYELSKNWKILYNRGQCLVMLKRDPEAVNVFQRYLEEGGAQIPLERRKRIEEDLPKLRARSATIRVEGAPAGSLVFLGEWKVGSVVKQSDGSPTEMTIPIGAGEHDLRVEPPPGYTAAPFRKRLTVSSGTQAAVHVEFEAPSAAPSAPGPAEMPPPPPPPQDPVLPPRPPGGLAAPSLHVALHLGAVVPSGDYRGATHGALGGAELNVAYRASALFEVGLFAGFAAGSRTLTPDPSPSTGAATRDVVDSNVGYSYSTVGLRGRMHLVRAKYIDGWFGLDFATWRESWKFRGVDSFDFSATSPAFGISVGFDVPLSRSWAIGASARFLSASATNGQRSNCASDRVCARAYLPDEGAGGTVSSARGFLDFGARIVWVLPFGDDPETKSPAETPAKPKPGNPPKPPTGTASLSAPVKLW